MPLSDITNLVSAAANCLSALAVIGSIWFLARQTKAATRSLDNVAKGLRQTTLQVARTHVSEINELLLNHDDLRQLFFLERKEVLAFMLLNDFEHLYIQYQEGLISSDFWAAKQDLIRQTVNVPFVRDLWQRANTVHSYQKAFAAFVDSMIEAGSPSN